MIELERAVVDLVKMGLRGDIDSVQQYARRLLRRAKKGAGEDGEFRESLGAALLESGSALPTLRRGETPQIMERHSRRALGRGESSSGTIATRDEELPRDSSSSLSLVRVDHPGALLVPLLDSGATIAIQSLLAERGRLAALRDAGVSPTRTVLLTGAPGVGKTMTAKYIAVSLELPLVVVDLASVMSSFLGRTGQNLRQAIEYARTRPCVLLLDEFDALAKRRDDQTDVGELKRIVNVLLAELESWPDTGLLLAATNHPELLDRAIWRRFDMVVPLGFPDLEARQEILCRELGSRSVSPAFQAIVEFCALATEGLSGSDVSQLAKSALRTATVSGQQLTELLVASARARINLLSKDSRTLLRELATLAVRTLGWNQRRTGELLGVSHVTVGNWTKKAAKETIRKRANETHSLERTKMLTDTVARHRRSRPRL